MSLKVAQFTAVVLTSLALVPGGAHLFALPNKMGLGQEEYFTVQGVYRGWALFGIVVIGALIADAGLAVMVRRHRDPCRLAALAALCLAATLVIFFVWTYPANQATSNWTLAPSNWSDLRVRWEYSHAVNAVLTFVAVCAVTLSVLAPPREWAVLGVEDTRAAWESRVLLPGVTSAVAVATRPDRSGRGSPAEVPAGPGGGHGGPR